MPSFQKLVKTLPGTKEHEQAKIDYLFERLSSSPYNFIRNEQAYTNSRAVAHLRWKYLHYVGESETAESFINLVASSSKSSGEPYYLKVSEMEYYPLKIVWQNELRELNQAYSDWQDEQKMKAQSSNVRVLKAAKEKAHEVER